MDFEYSARTRELMQRVDDFMQAHVFPVEAEYEDFVQDPARRWVVPPLVDGASRRRRAKPGCGTCSCRTSTSRGARA